MRIFYTLLFIILLPDLACTQNLDRTELTKYEGFFDFYYDQHEDRIYLSVEDLDTPFLYIHFLASGVGSNDVGLDRGQLGDGVVVEFRKAGNKLLLVQPNLEFRAYTTNVPEKESVKEAFAFSVLAGFEIEEKTAGGAYIIDLTPFLLRDAHGVARKIREGNHGSFNLDLSRSALYLERTRAFPENVEFEGMLTFEGRAKSRTLRRVLPNEGILSVRQHHSFVKLPDDKYKKREFDPRSGALYISYFDYATPVYEPIEKKYIVRHRLTKKYPDAAESEAVEPIVYYIDPGTPEPVRSALLDGAEWWDEAFQAIGYKNAFQVKILPEGADPLDSRYNVIQWVHRSTRGWSYGASVVDPRTGEIIKGHVSLGSLRIRQDLKIAQALSDRPFAESDSHHEEMLEMALARIRQLAAHEVGHTLGFAHNFAASVSGGASVMDYPHPEISLKRGKIDFSQAYDSGVGQWDKVTVAYSYGEVPASLSEEEYLNGVIAGATAQGLQFISDRDARAKGGAHINAHLWDNGVNAAQELEHILEVRKTAIQDFSVENIRMGEPYSVLEDVFVPLYFLHRYQTEAAVKLIGGLNYNYNVKGGNEAPHQIAEEDLQKDALEAVLTTLSAEVLAIPEEKLQLFPPRAFGYGRSRESFHGNTGVTFDAFGPAATASDFTLSLLLRPERAARLIQQHALENSLGLEELLRTLISKTIKNEPRKDYPKQVQRTINYQVLLHLFALSANDQATIQVRAKTNAAINELDRWLTNMEDPYHNQLKKEIEEFRKDPDAFKKGTVSPRIPDGSPIGSYYNGI